jgi:hypothetical protein
MVKPGTQLANLILEYLHRMGIKAWRNNSGSVLQSAGGKVRRINYGLKGSSDIIGWMPGGKFLAIEVKVGKDKLSEDQFNFLGDARRDGCVVIEAKTLQDVEDFFTKYNAYHWR